MSEERCEYCGRRFDRPSFYEPCADKHPKPDEAQILVEKISDEIHSRKGIGWDFLDSEIVDEIRDDLANTIRCGVEGLVTRAVRKSMGLAS